MQMSAVTFHKTGFQAIIRVWGTWVGWRIVKWETPFCLETPLILETASPD